MDTWLIRALHIFSESGKGTRDRVPTTFSAILLLASLLLLASFFISCAPFPPEQARAPLPIQHAARTQLNYVAIGASDTFGVGTEDPRTQSWPSVLARKLGTSAHLVNLGIPSIIVHDALNIELPVALDAHPNLVTIWLAVNDLAVDVPLDSYSHDLDLLLSRLQAALPHTQIVVANVPDLTLLPHFKSTDLDALRQKIAIYNTAILEIVTRHHVVLVDLYQQWQALASHPEYISDDGFHPDAEGYAQLAEIFYQTIQKQSS